MNYAKYAHELSEKMQQAIRHGKYNAPCEAGVLDCAAAQMAAILEKNGYTSSREVMFCKDSKGGRIEVCVIVDGVTDPMDIRRLNNEHCRIGRGEIIPMGESRA